MTDRDTLKNSFLSASGWANANIKPLAADASSRSYDRLAIGDKKAILMNAPFESGENVLQFVEVTRHLQAFGLAPPNILAQDLTNGFLLIEDFGDLLFARLCETDPKAETEIYHAAVDVLLALHRNPAPSTLPRYDVPTYIREANLIWEWYIPTALGRSLTKSEKLDFEEVVSKTCKQVSEEFPVMVMRDYHAENLLWLPERNGVKRVGLLDYQDALAGHPSYDLVSLLEDARRDTSKQLRDEMLAMYVDQSGEDSDEFNLSYNVLGAQRNTKIIGIFSRLSQRDGKPDYVDLIPRVWKHLQRDLEHPVCSSLKSWIDEYAPAPTLEILEKLKAQNAN